MSQDAIRENWNEIKAGLLHKWNAIASEDLDSFNGNVQQLVDTIQRKTGEARDSIEQYFEQFSADSSAALGQANAFVRAGAQQAAESIQHSSKRVVSSVRKGYDDVEKAVQRSPGKSLAICFGAGLLAGILVTMVMRRR